AWRYLRLHCTQLVARSIALVSHLGRSETSECDASTTRWQMYSRRAFECLQLWGGPGIHQQ
ncbi:unnamed protein product, partial [Ixodes persulcatus]